MLGGLVPGDWGSGAGAGVASMALLVLAFRGVRRVKATQRRLRVSSVLGSHHCRGDHDLVQLPTAEVVAYTVGGRRPQVVLSQGLLEAVGPAGVDAVCAHERVHVRYGHHRYLMVLAGIAAAFRWYLPAGRGAAMVRFGLERWADEEAGRFSPRGRLGLRNALLAAAFQPVVAEATGFGSADTVAARVRALTGPPPTSPRGLVAVGYAVIGLAGLTAVILLTWATRMSVLALTNPGLCVL
jgi:beta-lactamase regulating signal transducer with metallopeptidase domain